MTQDPVVVNEHGQPVGPSLAGWSPPPFPPATRLAGRHVTLIPLEEEHARPLFEVLGPAPDRLWTYMGFGPFDSSDDLAATISEIRAAPGWLPYAILAGESLLGFASYLRIDPANGAIEIGSIVFSPALQKTTAATEAIFLMIDNAFALGYRRCEWKCDDLNVPSRRAAERFGFEYEGTFRQATHYKGRNRDTAWYALIDADWPRVRGAFTTWLSPANFDERGRQLRTLRSIRDDG